MPDHVRAYTSSGAANSNPGSQQASRNFGGFLRNLGGRARSSSNFTGASGSPVSTPAAKQESAESKLSSLLTQASKASVTANAGQQPNSLLYGSSWSAASVASSLNTTSDVQQQVQLAKKLANTVRIDTAADLAEIWQTCSHLLEAHQPPELRNAGVDLLKACVEVLNDSVSELGYSYERASHYAAIQRYFESRKDMSILEMQSLVFVIETLTRGGRDVSGLEDLVPFLLKMALAMTAVRNAERLKNIDLSSATSPLLDPTFSTPFITIPVQSFHFTQDPKASPASLMIACHRYSFPGIPPAHVSLLLKTFVDRALRNLGEYEVIKVLELVDTIVKFGYIPVDQIEDVVKFVARAAGLEGRCKVYTISTDGQKKEGELSETFKELAARVMRNMLRSSANQALRCLRETLSASHKSASGQARCQTPLLVGTIRCLRRAFIDHEGSSSAFMGEGDRPNDRYPSLLSTGMTLLHQNLLDVLHWRSSEIDSEVLLFLEERFANHQSKKTHLTFEEWEMVISIVEKLVWRIQEWEESVGQTWSVDVGAIASPQSSVFEGMKAGIAPATLSTAPPVSPGIEAPKQVPILPVLDSFSLVIHRMMSAQAHESFTGSHLRYFDFMLSIARHLSVSFIQTFFGFFKTRMLASPGRSDWLDRVKMVLETFFPAVPYSVLRESVKHSRRTALDTLQDAYSAAHGYPMWTADLVEQVMIPFFERILPVEQDETVIATSLSLMQLFVKDCLTTRTELEARIQTCMQNVLSLIESLTWLPSVDVSKPDRTPREGTRASTRSPARGSSRQQASAPSTGISLAATQTLISLLLQCIILADRSGARLAVRIFHHLLDLLQPAKPGIAKARTAPVRTRLAVLQCLARLRADQRHRIWSRQHLEMDTLAASIGRLAAGGPQRSASHRVGDAHSEVDRGRRAARRENLESEKSNSRPQTGASSRSRTRASNPQSPSRQPPLLWTCPDHLLYTFPSKPVKGVGFAGLVSFDHIRMRDWTEATAEAEPDYSGQSGPSEEPDLIVLRVSDYLEVLIECLEYEVEWELVSYILCAVPNQLSNKHYACGPECARQLITLRSLLCEKLSKETLCEQVKLSQNVRRSDMHTIAYQWLATLIAYRDLYNREAQNETVLTFLQGLSRTPAIAKQCIHALLMACYEFESSMSKYLPEILNSLVRIMSTVNMPVHILELVASIGHIRSLYANFTEDDYKKVFALAAQYLSSHYDSLADEPTSEASPEDLSKATSQAFKQYVFLLSYYVIALWYTIVPPGERARYTSFLVKRLPQAKDDQSEVDPAAQVSLDMLARLAYGLPATQNGASRSQNRNREQGRAYSRSWVCGQSVITLEGTEKAKEAQITIRRASGVLKASVTLDESQSEVDVLQLLLANRDRLQIPASIQIDYPAHELPPIFDADPAFFSLFLPPHSHINTHGRPLAVQESGQAKRSISVLDTMPHIDFHKIGVLYVGAGQKTEEEILRNIHGSRGYMEFLQRLGVITRLQGYPHSTGGLDREMDFDGKWAYIWSDEIQQIIFHIATLMPTRIEEDPTCTYKKRHIGNDYIKIIYNDSGSRIPFDILPGQFNFVNILIEPHTPAGEAWRGQSGIANNTEFFRVSLQQRPDMPEFGPLGAFKMVSTESLASFVRELALHANIFAQLFLQSVGVEGRSAGRQRVEYSSTWRTRLQAIKRLKEAAMAEANKSSTTEGPQA